MRSLTTPHLPPPLRLPPLAVRNRRPLGRGRCQWPSPARSRSRNEAGGQERGPRGLPGPLGAPQPGRAHRRAHKSLLQTEEKTRHGSVQLAQLPGWTKLNIVKHSIRQRQTMVLKASVTLTSKGIRWVLFRKFKFWFKD